MRVPPPLYRTAAPLGALVAVVAAFACVGVIDPHEPGRYYPTCPLLALTGLFCPGCGGLRSAHAVAHGDLAGAVGANALAVVGYAALATLLAGWLLCAVVGRPVTVRPGPRTWWCVSGVVTAFSVLRNLPYGAGLVP